jgi:hypothetical protein
MPPSIIRAPILIRQRPRAPGPVIYKMM